MAKTSSVYWKGAKKDALRYLYAVMIEKRATFDATPRVNNRPNCIEFGNVQWYTAGPKRRRAENKFT